MTRKLHTAFNGLAALSCLVFLGTVALCGRAYNGHADCLRYQLRSRPLTAADVASINAAEDIVTTSPLRWPELVISEQVLVGVNDGDLVIAKGNEVWRRSDSAPNSARWYIDRPLRLGSLPSLDYGILWEISTGDPRMRGLALPLWAILSASAVLPVWKTVARYRTNIRQACQALMTALPREASTANRKRRIARNTLATLSWLLCMAAIELWFRSIHGDRDSLRFEFQSWPAVETDFLPAGVSGITLAQRLSIWPQLHMTRGVWAGVAKDDLFFTQGTVIWPRNEAGVQQVDLGLVYQPFGRKFWRADIGGAHVRGGAVPLWVIVVASGIMPVWIAFSFYRKKIRRYKNNVAGLCQACGYDLRASLARCPECRSVSMPAV